MQGDSGSGQQMEEESELCDWLKEGSEEQDCNSFEGY